MAGNRRIEKKKFAKKPRASRIQQAAVDLQYMGTEPNPPTDREINDLELSQAYYWYNYSCTAKEAREYIEKWLESKAMDYHLPALKKVPDSRIPTTVAWQCRMEMRGAILSERSLKFRDDRLRKMMEYVGQKDDVEPESEEKSNPGQDIQSKVREFRANLIGDIEEQLDTDPDFQFNMYEYLTKRQVKPIHCTAIAAYYGKQADEFEEALKGKDPDLKEGYHHMKKALLKIMAERYRQYSEEAERYGQNTKKTRVIERKPKVISSDKMLKDFKFKKDDKDLQIASVNPADIIGSSELWVYSTKYKTMTVYRSQGPAGLQVKYTSIANFDPDISKAASCGRKPTEHIKAILEGGKVTLKKFHEDKKPGYFKPRITPDDILLRVVK